MTTAWMLGGDRITFNGHGTGTFDGNGQIWYDLANGVGNLPGRPISLMITNTTNSRFTNLRFVQSQFWTMAIKNAEDVLLDSIYINSTSSTSDAESLSGGGGGLGYARNLIFRDFKVSDLTDSVAFISQCTSYSGATGGCDTSLFQISDVTWGPMVGNVASPTLASLQCSGSAPCPGIRFVDFDAIATTGNSGQITCENVENPIGFNCTS
ncbi:hypothetical protein C0995_011080 [Termitomyces sp. Mi166|nr:hypothetical protein C0995_011080 [Termitomyces sp. Mi166\